MTSVFVDVLMYIEAQQPSERLAAGIIDAITGIGAKIFPEYDLLDGEHDYYENVSIEDIKRALSKHPLSVHVAHNDLHFDLYVHPTHERRRYGELRFNCYTTPFRNSTPNHKKNSEILAEVAYAIWEALPRPIYGDGDLEGGDGNTIVSDEELNKLDIKVNGFWMNFYGRRIVEKYGVEALKKGAYKSVEGNNGIFTMSREVLDIV